MEVHFNGSLDSFRSLMLYLHSRHGGTEWTLPSGTRLVIQECPCSDPTLQMMSWEVSTPRDVEGPNRRHAVIQAFSRDKNSTVVLLEDCRIISLTELSPNKVQVLDPDRAIGPPFDELCQELLRQMNVWAPPLTAPQAQGNATQFSPSFAPSERPETTTPYLEDGSGSSPAQAAGDVARDEKAGALSLRDGLPKSERTRQKWREVYSLWLDMKEEYLELYKDGATSDPEPSKNDLKDRVIFELGSEYSVRWLRAIIRAGESGYLG